MRRAERHKAPSPLFPFYISPSCSTMSIRNWPAPSPYTASQEVARTAREAKDCLTTARATSDYR